MMLERVALASWFRPSLFSVRTCMYSVLRIGRYGPSLQPDRLISNPKLKSLVNTGQIIGTGEISYDETYRLVNQPLG